MAQRPKFMAHMCKIEISCTDFWSVDCRSLDQQIYSGYTAWQLLFTWRIGVRTQIISLLYKVLVKCKSVLGPGEEQKFLHMTRFSLLTSDLAWPCLATSILPGYDHGLPSTVADVVLIHVLNPVSSAFDRLLASLPKIISDSDSSENKPGDFRKITLILPVFRWMMMTEVRRNATKSF